MCFYSPLISTRVERTEKLWFLSWASMLWDLLLLIIITAVFFSYCQFRIHKSRAGKEKPGYNQYLFCPDKNYFLCIFKAVFLFQMRGTGGCFLSRTDAAAHTQRSHPHLLFRPLPAAMGQPKWGEIRLWRCCAPSNHRHVFSVHKERTLQHTLAPAWFTLALTAIIKCWSWHSFCFVKRTLGPHFTLFSSDPILQSLGFVSAWAERTAARRPHSFIRWNGKFRWCRVKPQMVNKYF